MKRWQKWLVNALKLKGTLDTEKLIREKNRRILELEQKVAELQSRLWHPKLVHVEIDQAGQKVAQSQIGCYEKPERTTGPVQGIRRRATLRHFQENPGILMQHEREMQKRAQTVKLDPETVILPVTKQPSKPHLRRLYAEPDSTFNAL